MTRVLFGLAPLISPRRCSSRSYRSNVYSEYFASYTETGRVDRLSPVHALLAGSATRCNLSPKLEFDTLCGSGDSTTTFQSTLTSNALPSCDGSTLGSRTFIARRDLGLHSLLSSSSGLLEYSFQETVISGEYTCFQTGYTPRTMSLARNVRRLDDFTFIRRSCAS